MIYHSQLFDDKSALNEQAIIGFAEMGRAIYTKYIIVFGAGVTAGTLVVEESHSATYAGAWVNLGTVAWSAADKAHSVLVTGPSMFHRLRISVAVVDGTVDAFALIRY